MTSPAIKSHDGHRVKRENRFEGWCFDCLETVSLLAPLPPPTSRREPVTTTKAVKE